MYEVILRFTQDGGFDFLGQHKNSILHYQRTVSSDME